MVRLFLPTNGCIRLLTDLLLLAVILLPVRGFGRIKWPTRDLFFDTKVIPENKEVTTYLLRNTPKDVFFLREDDDPVNISVIPCASPVEWIVTYRNGSGKRNQQYYNYTGSEKHTFTLRGQLRMIFTITIRALTSDTRVHFFATKKSYDDYPQLPRDYKVEGAVVQRRRISVSWKDSPDVLPYDNIVTYCISISKGRSYPTHCSLKAHLYGDTYMAPSSDAGFGYESQENEYREMASNARPVQPAKRGQIVYKCIGTKTNYMYTRAKRNTRYFINVYVINNKTNRTSAYTGLELKTMKGRKVKSLKYGKVNKFTLKRPKQKEVMKLKLTSFTKKLFLAIHVCRGKVKFQVIHRGKPIANISRLRNIKTFVLEDLEPDDYLVKVTNSRKGVRDVRVFVSNRTEVHRHHNPDLPNDTRIIVSNTLTTCNSVTIAWVEAAQRQTYCLYKKEILPSPTERRRRRTKSDSCKTSYLKSSEKIICKKFRKHKRNTPGVTQYEITGLKPGTSYQFDVVVSRRKRHLFPYKSVISQTRTEC